MIHDKLLIAPDFVACLVSILAAMASFSDQSIVVGGGLAGMSAANTVSENGGSVFLLDKFTSDTLKGGAKKPELAKVLCENSGADVEWLLGKFSLDLSLAAHLGGHLAPRTHRGKERFPGRWSKRLPRDHHQSSCDGVDNEFSCFCSQVLWAKDKPNHLTGGSLRSFLLATWGQIGNVLLSTYPQTLKV